MSRYHFIGAGLVVAAGLATAAAPASAADEKPAHAATSKEAEIPFPSFGTVDDFVADGTRAVYIKGRGPQWYHATLMGSCTQLPWVNAIGIENTTPDTFDRHSTIVVDGQRCALSSLVESPPPKGKK